MPKPAVRQATLSRVARDIAKRGAEHPVVYFETLNKLEAVLQWVSERTEEAGGDDKDSPAEAKRNGADAEEAKKAERADAITSLHPSLSISELREPSKPGTKAHRSAEKRFKSNGEKEKKGRKRKADA
jgi:alkanesulfonate monooxygenase SsuD/methylene tetrahydromethanopterin reductase-like flavin-dependent oxidoreductase (luciferase family)